MLLLLISQHVTHHVEWSDSARHEEPGTKSCTKLHREVTKYGDEKREGKEGKRQNMEMREGREGKGMGGNR